MQKVFIKLDQPLIVNAIKSAMKEKQNQKLFGKEKYLSSGALRLIDGGQIFSLNWIKGVSFNLIYKSDMCPFF
jgi:hypothetical protein